MSSPSPPPAPATLGQQLLHWLPLITALIIATATIFGVRFQVESNTSRISSLEQEIVILRDLPPRVSKLEEFMLRVDDKLDDQLSILQYLRGKQEAK